MVTAWLAALLLAAPLPVADANRATLQALFEGVTPEASWREVVFHHSATTAGSAASFDRYHREKFQDPDGMEYHFVIGNGAGSRDGLIEVGERWRRQKLAYHLFTRERDEGSIAICLVGNFEEGAARPTAAQERAALELAAALTARYGIAPAAVVTHRAIDGKLTQCPGKNFPIEPWRARLAPAAPAARAE